MSGSRRRYHVYQQDKLVLELVDEPGPLISRMAPPPLPGQSLIRHPFLTAIAHLPEREELLRRKLDESSNLQEFLSAVESLGMKVVEQHSALEMGNDH
jgi:hypothetical protein